MVVIGPFMNCRIRGWICLASEKREAMQYLINFAK